MKRFLPQLLLLAFCIVGLNVYAEAPKKLSYQAVVRNSDNALIKSSIVGMKITILQGSGSGTIIYAETQTPTTNLNGVVSVEIGVGNAATGDFATIDWSQGPFFIKTEIDPQGGAAYAISSTAQLLSVPYALHANTAGSITGTLNETDPTFTQNFDLTGAASGDLLKYNGAKWVKETPQYVKNASETVSGDLMFYDGSNWVSKKLTPSVVGSNLPVSIMQPYLALNYCIAVQGVFPARDVADPMIGTIVAFGFNFTPRYWLPCNGQLLSIAQNTALFALLGTIYGGDGRTTFGLPDLRGRAPIHYGQSTQGVTYDLGQAGGAPTITLTTLNIPAHTHTIVYE